MAVDPELTASLYNACRTSDLQFPNRGIRVFISWTLSVLTRSNRSGCISSSSGSC